SRCLGGAEVVRRSSRSRVVAAISRTAASKASWLARDGFEVPLILRTYCSAAACTSSSVAGGAKLWRVRMLRHMCVTVRRYRCAVDPDERPTSGWSHLFEEPAAPPRRRPSWWVVAPVAVVGVVVVTLVLSGVLGLLAGFRPPWAPGSQEVSPFTDRAMYADPDSRTARAAAKAEQAGSPDAATLRRLAATPQGIWLVPEEHGVDSVARHVERIVDDAGDAVPVLVVYGVPQRDCTGGFSAGGLAGDEYLAWIGAIADGLGRA